MVNISEFRGVLFDLDGTLVDTMPLHYRAYQQVLGRRGVDLAWSVFMQHAGPPAAEAIPLFVAAAGSRLSFEEVAMVHDEKKVAFEAILASASPPVLPASRLLNQLSPDQVCGLVTSGNRRGAEAILRSLGWAEFFGTVVTGDDVDRGKPDPAPYLLAAERLGVKPADCVALEDTPDGLTSARAAGVQAWDVRQISWQ